MDDKKIQEKPAPDLKDVEPGSDADETPVSKPGKTPPNPNDTSRQSVSTGGRAD